MTTVSVTKQVVAAIQVNDAAAAVVPVYSTPLVLQVGVQGPIGPPGTQGPKGDIGPQGLPGAGSSFTAIAGETIGGDKCVRLGADGKVYLADSSTTTYVGKVCGITQSAVTTGDTATIVTGGELVFSGTTPGAIYYVGTSGNITSTRPIVGFVQSIGIGSGNGINVSLSLPIVL